MKIRDKPVITIASPFIPLGHVAVSYRLYHSLELEIGELVNFEIGGLKKLYVHWAHESDHEKASLLTNEEWIILNDKSPGITFDFHILRDTSRPVLPSLASQEENDESKWARTYLESLLGKDLVRDLDIEIYKPTPKINIARIYYKVWASGTYLTTESIEKAINQALVNLNLNLLQVGTRIDETIDNISSL